MRSFRSTDLASINKWLKRHRHESVTMQELPALGWVVPGVAAAFLRHCEGNVAIMDSLVTNSLVSPQQRDAALNRLFVQIKQAGYSRILGFTRDDGALERAKRHGFHTVNQSILAYTEE